MANMMDYLDWRGDIKLVQDPFNEVDNLILSQLVYVNLEYIVPARAIGQAITMREAAERYFMQYTEEQIQQTSYINRISIPLLRKLAQCPRFADTRLSRFEKVTDLDRIKQFAAVRMELGDNSVYYAFRGTDNSIVGWKENFNMCISMPVAAQYEALRYLEDMEEEAVQGGEAPKQLRLGGHSKGGNLAVYAAVMCKQEIKDRILAVYNNDGPGFNEKLTQSEAYQQMLTRITTIVPQSSIVGMLLEHREEYTIVQSNASLLMQHEAFTWEVMGNSFVKEDNLEKKNELIDMTIKSWLNQLDRGQRQQFIAAVFHVFDAGDIRTIDDLSKAKWSKINEMIRALNQSKEYKLILLRAFRLLLKEGRKALLTGGKSSVKRENEETHYLN